MIGDTPTLLTDRLRLRPPVMEDFPAHAAYQGDLEIMRYITGAPCSEEEAWRRFMGAVGHWALFGYGFWAIEELATSKVLGEIGFIHAKRVIETCARDTEMGWLLGREGQGKGYAFEAGQAVMSWGRRNLDADRFTALISPENSPSIRLAEKFGFTFDRQTPYQDEQVNIYTCPFETSD